MLHSLLVSQLEVPRLLVRGREWVGATASSVHGVRHASGSCDNGAHMSGSEWPLFKVLLFDCPVVVQGASCKAYAG